MARRSMSSPHSATVMVHRPTVNSRVFAAGAGALEESLFNGGGSRQWSALQSCVAASMARSFLCRWVRGIRLAGCRAACVVVVVVVLGAGVDGGGGVCGRTEVREVPKSGRFYGCARTLG